MADTSGAGAAARSAPLMFSWHWAGGFAALAVVLTMLSEFEQTSALASALGWLIVIGAAYMWWPQIVANLAF